MMEWKDKEDHVVVIALHKCGLERLCIVELLKLLNDKKCIKKKERVRHLLGYCPQTSQETKDAEER